MEQFASQPRQPNPGVGDLAFIPARQQQVWGWPVIANFTIGAAGAGLFVFNLALERWVGRAGLADSTSVTTAWLGPLLVVLGLASLAMEAGRPLRVWFVFGNLRRSWMSREALAACAFLATAALALASPAGWLRLVAGGLALLFILSQGFIIRQCRAVPAWNTSRIVWVFVSSALLTGAGVWCLLASASLPGLAEMKVVLASWMLLILFDAAAWFIYLSGSADVAFLKATHWLKSRWLWSLVVYRVVPLAMLSLTIPMLSRSGLLPRVGVMASAVLVIAGAVAQKAGLLQHCGYLREISLQRHDSPPQSRHLVSRTTKVAS